MTTKSKLEYIWLDGYAPTQNMRSKTMVRDDFSGNLEDCPIWMFDGSSTRQADGNASDCLLKPVAIFPDPQRISGYLVMCEVMNPDGTPHVSNGRATIDDDDDDFWFGFEQEYFIMDVETQLPLGFPVGGYPGPQGLYYCSVGGKNTTAAPSSRSMRTSASRRASTSRASTRRLPVGSGSSRCSPRVPRTPVTSCGSRYLLDRLTESYGYYIEYHPKPVKGDWNGSGMHANFSNGAMRETGGKDMFDAIREAFGQNIDKHMAVYGAHNRERLTGLHETQAYDQFSYGVSDRGASIRALHPCRPMDGSAA